MPEPEAKKTLSPLAYRELKPGEKYEPFIPASERLPELTVRSVLVGIIMVILFSVAATYSGLKVAQVFEAAIPISVLAVGLSGFLGKRGLRRNSILENVIIQSIGAASGLVVAGSIFTLPALYIMGVAPNWQSMLVTIFAAAVLGGLLGILFLVPLRRYFVAEQHGKLPFPEATATNEIFITGEAGGAQARTLLVAAAIGGLYDFLVTSCKVWQEYINFQFIPWFKRMAQDTKAQVSLDGVSFIVGLGFITGLRFSSIIFAGGLFSTLLLVPLIWHFGIDLGMTVPPGRGPIGEMDADQIFALYARRVGVGAMAGAGIIGIIKSMGTIVSAFSLGFKQLFSRRAADAEPLRTDRDLRMSTVIAGIVVSSIVVLAFFYIVLIQNQDTAPGALKIALMGLVITFIFSFLFTTVAAQATAMTGNNPISGMTLVTLIIGSALLMQVGLKGDFGKYAAIIMGAVVCTALAMSGGFVTDLKIGYWLGSTPRRQQISKVVGTAFAAVFVGLTVMLIHKAYGHVDAATGSFISGFMNTREVPAPQANLFANILGGIFDMEPITWLLYGAGILVSVLMWMMNIPPLAFAIGMYLPISVNFPLFVGGVISHFVAKSSKDPKTSEARTQKGTLIASGYIAGGAIMGVVGALLIVLGVKMPILTGGGVEKLGGGAEFVRAWFQPTAQQMDQADEARSKLSEHLNKTLPLNTAMTYSLRDATAALGQTMRFDESSADLKTASAELKRGVKAWAENLLPRVQPGKERGAVMKPEDLEPGLFSDMPEGLMSAISRYSALKPGENIEEKASRAVKIELTAELLRRDLASLEEETKDITEKWKAADFAAAKKDDWSQAPSLLAFLALCLFLYFSSRKAAA